MDMQTIGMAFRRRRVEALIAIIDGVYKSQQEVRILDMGGTEHYWKAMPAGFLESRNVSIVCANPFRRQTDFGCFTFTQDDACRLPYPDLHFDIAHSNSVIEHVGDWTRMKDFSREARRVARRYFIQTPNYWFPIEPHCFTPLFHWMPAPARAALLMRFRLGHFKRACSYDEAMQTVESSRLLNAKMMRALFPDGEIIKERIAGLPKSLIALRAN